MDDGHASDALLDGLGGGEYWEGQDVFFNAYAGMDSDEIEYSSMDGYESMST